MSMRKPLRLSALVLAISIGAACANLGDVPGDANYPIADDGIYNPYSVPLDPLYQVSTAPVDKVDKQRDVDTYAVPPKNVYVDNSRQKKEPDLVYPGEPSKISPVLQQWLKETGTWTLRIRGYRVRTGTQTVYWASHIER